MISAEKGIINIPTMIDDNGERFFIIVVIRFTNRKTKKGFTLAIHPGEASVPSLMEGLCPAVYDLSIKRNTAFNRHVPYNTLHSNVSAASAPAHRA